MGARSNEGGAMRRAALVAVALLVSCVLVRAEEAGSRTGATRPARIRVTDRGALEKALEQDVTVEGTVQKASWSRSGRVMNVVFKGADDGFRVVVFQKDRAKMDEAFGGDAARALTGKNVEVRGRVERYEGEISSIKGQVEIIVREVDQIRIVGKAASRPSTRAAVAVE
jgi:DNA/RNA endonuclease YhcR with UshA esterase domain